MKARLAIIGRSMQAEWYGYHPAARSWYLVYLAFCGYIAIVIAFALSS
jgi:hypothetical protein